MPLRLARTQPRLKQRGERPAHLPDPLCARPAPARPTHAMSSASAMHVHVHIPQDHPSPVHVHLCPPDGKWKPPPSGATFGEDYDAASDCTEGSAEQIAIPRAREEQGPVRGSKKLYPRAREEPGPVRGKGTDKKKVARPVGGKGTAAGKKKGKKKAGP